MEEVGAGGWRHSMTFWTNLVLPGRMLGCVVVAGSHMGKFLP